LWPACVSISKSILPDRGPVTPGRVAPTVVTGRKPRMPWKWLGANNHTLSGGWNVHGGFWGQMARGNSTPKTTRSLSDKSPTSWVRFAFNISASVLPTACENLSWLYHLKKSSDICLWKMTQNSKRQPAVTEAVSCYTMCHAPVFKSHISGPKGAWHNI